MCNWDSVPEYVPLYIDTKPVDNQAQNHYDYNYFAILKNLDLYLLSKVYCEVSCLSFFFN